MNRCREVTQPPRPATFILETKLKTMSWFEKAGVYYLSVTVLFVSMLLGWGIGVGIGVFVFGSNPDSYYAILTVGIVGAILVASITYFRVINHLDG